jgi:hypothetical protein
MSPTAQIKGLLEALGSTADEVAAALKAEGARGVRHAVHMLNPVVRYLQRHLLGDASVDVMQPDKARLTFGGGRKEETPLPEPVRQFLDAFNRGAYPELELPPE